MQYHIQTDPIWEAFKADCECPLCYIYSKYESKLVNSYLNDAVMEPDARIEENKYGFCREHLRKLYNGQNKLGLSLQLNTRLQTIGAGLIVPSSYKQAAKQADELEKATKTCVICNSLDTLMTRYAQTVAQMYSSEAEFEPLLNKSNGFCMAHYALLLKTANYAGSKTKPYLSTLSYLQNRTISKVHSELDRFSMLFDYRNAGSGQRPDAEVVPMAIRKLTGPF